MLTILEKVFEAQNAFYDVCELKIKNLLPEKESAEYYAHTYVLNSKNIHFRIAKKTPTKSGWFVTMWKRNSDGITAPYDKTDKVDFFVINIVNENQLGQFVFPKSVLIEKNIFSTNHKEGKRGTRVYSPWDETSSKQAKNTQVWQKEYFIDISKKDSKSIERFKKLYFV